MFDIGWGELLVIGIVALIAIGPKELPGVLRMVGQWVGKIRRMAGEFQNQFQEAMREVELAELKKEVDEMAAKAADYTNFDPIADVRKEVEDAQREIEMAAAVGETPATETPALNAPEAAAPSGGEPAKTEPVASADAVAPEPAPAPSAPEEVKIALEPVKEPVRETVKHEAGGRDPA
jgi:sec-independent protein translocase protein TatB